MMSYVNTMQDFLDKVIVEIECNSPSRRDSVPARTLIRDLSDVRKRLPSRKGHVVRAMTPSFEALESKNQSECTTHQESENLATSSESRNVQLKSEHLIKDEQRSFVHLQQVADSSEEIGEQYRRDKSEENANVLKTESFILQNQYQPSQSHISSTNFENRQNEYRSIPSPSLDQKYEVHFQGHFHVNSKTGNQEFVPLSDPSKVVHNQNFQVNQQTDQNMHIQEVQERKGNVENHQKHEYPVYHREEETDAHPHIEDQYPHTRSLENPATSEPHIEPPSPEVPLPPTWVENMLSICDIPLLIPAKFETEAFVTMATNNLTAVGAMVLGNSLRLSNTSRTLAVLIADEVTDELRNVLASVFHVVQRISSLEPMGSTKLALLEQPELGITYSKLLVWRMTQFERCVFLSPDTLVIQNCDELFERNEISAVPDIGWPDCFNTAVFVFTPSDETFWNLVNFAETKGSFDGGDQGLLNMYFRSWSLDIHKRLPFIYNLMANVSYTYGPAFVKFGGNAKVVHFFGTTKPWNIQFNVVTGQVAPFSGVHPTFASYVQYWLTIFARCVLPLFSQDVQEYSTSHNYVNALDLARIVTGSSDTVFSFSPPSFRRYLDSSEQVSFPVEKVQNTVLVRMEEKEPSSESEEELVAVEKTEEEEKDEILNDYNRMLAWEQGRMDYLGQDSSDNVLKRLNYAIRKGDKLS